MISKINKICNECNNIIGQKNSKFNKYLCVDCNKLDKYVLISKSYVKNEYFLNDNDLENIQSIKHNGLYKKLCTYYTKEDIINKTCEKYNIRKYQLEIFLNDIKLVNNKKKEDKHNKKLIKCEKRKLELINALNQG